MMSFGADPFGGGAARRRARVLERLESMDPENQGNIDKQKLVGAPCESIDREHSSDSAQALALSTLPFAASCLDVRAHANSARGKA